MSSSQPSQQNNLNNMTREERKEKLTQCLLSQYRFCAAGVVTGAGYSALKKATVRPGPWPMLTGGFVGTLGDFMFGYFVECAHLREGGGVFGVKSADGTATTSNNNKPS